MWLEAGKRKRKGGGEEGQQPRRSGRSVPLLILLALATATVGCASETALGFAEAPSSSGLRGLPDGMAIAELTSAPVERFPGIVQELPAELLLQADKHPAGFIAPAVLPPEPGWELVPWKATVSEDAYGYAFRSTKVADADMPPEIEIRIERVAGEQREMGGIEELGPEVEQLADVTPWPVYQMDAVESVTFALDDGSDVLTVRVYKGCPSRVSDVAAGVCWSWKEIAALVGGLTVMEVGA